MRVLLVAARLLLVHASKAHHGMEHASAVAPALPPPRQPAPPAPSIEWEAVVCAAFFAAGLVHGAAGFGAGMTSMAILPVRLPMLDATSVCSVFSLFVACTMAAAMRDALSNARVRTTLAILVAGAALGVPLGGVLLMGADPRLLRFVLGASMLLFVAERLLHELGHESKSGGSGKTRKPPQEAPGIEFTEVAAFEGGAPAETEPLHYEHEEPGARPESKQLLPAALSLAGGAGEAGGAFQSVIQPSSYASSYKDHAGPPRRRWVDHPSVALCVGIISGVLGGALNEGGPPVVIFLALKGW